MSRRRRIVRVLRTPRYLESCNGSTQIRRSANAESESGAPQHRGGGIDILGRVGSATPDCPRRVFEGAGPIR